MEADIISLGASSISGGAFGIAGTVLGRIAGYFERKQTLAHEQKKWAHEVVLHDLNMKARQLETELETELANQAGSWAGLEASIKAESAIGQGSHGVIDLLRLVRPALTLLLWLIVAAIFIITQDSDIVKAAVFAATAATLWWFGDRAPKPNKTAGER